MSMAPLTGFRKEFLEYVNDDKYTKAAQRCMSAEALEFASREDLIIAIFHGLQEMHQTLVDSKYWLSGSQEELGAIGIEGLGRNPDLWAEVNTEDVQKAEERLMRVAISRKSQKVVEVANKVFADQKAHEAAVLKTLNSTVENLLAGKAGSFDQLCKYFFLDDRLSTDTKCELLGKAMEHLSEEPDDESELANNLQKLGFVIEALRTAAEMQKSLVKYCTQISGCGWWCSVDEQVDRDRLRELQRKANSFTDEPWSSRLRYPNPAQFRELLAEPEIKQRVQLSSLLSDYRESLQRLVAAFSETSNNNLAEDSSDEEPDSEVMLKAKPVVQEEVRKRLAELDEIVQGDQESEKILGEIREDLKSFLAD